MMQIYFWYSAIWIDKKLIHVFLAVMAKMQICAVAPDVDGYYNEFS